MSNLRPDPTGLLLLFILGCIWGTSFSLITVTLDSIPPITMVAGRVIVGTVLLGLIALFRKELFPQSRIEWLGVIALGLVGNALPFFLITWGQQEVPSGLTAILMATMPIATVVLVHYLGGETEPLTKRRLLGVMLGFVAIVVVVGPSALGSAGGSLLHEASIIGGAMCYALATCIARVLPRGAPTARAAAMSLAAAIIMTPLAFLIEAPLAIEPTVRAWQAWGALSVGASGIALIIYFHIVGTRGAGFTAMVNFITPIVGVVVGALLLDEVIPPSALIALAMILVGVFLTGRGQNASK